MNTFFISDLHAFHEKLAIKRGFDNSDAMNRTIQRNWNRDVGCKDVVYIIGDVSFAKAGPTCEFLESLTGIKRIVPGNHDAEKVLDGLGAVGRNIEILPPQVMVKAVESQGGENVVTKVVLNHFPLLIWHECHYGAYHLHGHSHGSCRYPDDVRRMDVSCEAVNYTPISMTEVRARLADKDVPRWDNHVPKVRAVTECANDPDGGDARA